MDKASFDSQGLLASSDILSAFTSTVKDVNEDVLFAQDNSSLCASKDDVADVMGSDHFNDMNRENLKSSAYSFSSFCLDSIEICTNGRLSVEGNSGQPVLETMGFSTRVDPSESSAFRDEPSGGTLSKGAPFGCSVDQAESSSTKMSNLHNIDNLFTEEGCDVVKPETESNDGTSNRSMPITYAEQPPEEDHNLPDNNGLDELVDVRVCDICGDVGREALLALCCKCSDGAEHIYCMRIKLDQVPERDWVCEDCMLMQEPKRLKLTEVEGSESIRNPSHLTGISQGLPTKHPAVQHVDESKTNQSIGSSCLSVKRPAPDSVLRSALKHRAVVKGIQPQKPTSTSVSSLNIMAKSKDGSRWASSLGNQLTTQVVKSTHPLSCHQSPKPGSDNKITPPPKNINLHESVQPPMSPESGGKSKLTRVYSSKITNNGKVSCYRASSLNIQYAKKELEQEISSLGHRSPKPVQQFQPLKPSSVPGGKSQLTRVSSLKVMDKCEGGFQASSPCVKSVKKDVEQESLPSGHRAPKPEPQLQALRSSSFSGRKSRLNRVSSLKIMDKGEGRPFQESSFVVRTAKKEMEPASPPPGHRSTKTKPECHAGTKSKVKPISIAEDTSLGRTAKGSANRERKKFGGMELCKSKCFGSVGLAYAGVSNHHLAHVSRRENLRCGSERSSTEKRSHLCLPVDCFDSMEFKPPVAKMVSEIIDRPHSSSHDIKNVIGMQVNENSDLKALGSLACSGGSFENRLGKAVQKVDLGCPSKEDGSQVVASNKVLPVDLHDMENSPVVAPAGLADVASTGISAVPESECIWKGAFQLEEGGKLPNFCYGLQAHLSTCASPKVLDLVTKFHAELVLKEVPRLSTWPVQFQKHCPTEEDIALYFFAKDLLSHSRSYTMLVEGMIRHDLALVANFDGVQLLVFPSSVLPVRSQRWNELLFLWGVFRVRKVGHDNLHVSSVNAVAAALNEALSAAVNSGSLNRTPLCASGAGSLSASLTSDNSMKDPESVNPRAVQSSSSMLPIDQSCEIDEVSSVAKYLGAQRAEDLIIPKDSITRFGNDYGKEESFPDSTLTNNDLKEKEDGPVGYGNLETHILPFGGSDKDSLASVSKFPQEENRVDVISPSSFSIDSGPSGSSDGAGCSKSDEGQVDQFHDPSNYNAPNLDLCLRPMSEPRGGHVNLDLALGSPSTNNCNMKRFSNDRNSEHGNVSLFLSLGLPCSYG